MRKKESPVESEAQPLKQPMQWQIANNHANGESSPLSSVFSNEHSSKGSITQSSKDLLYSEVWLTPKEETRTGEIFITPNSRRTDNSTEGIVSISSITTQHNLSNKHGKVPGSQIFRSALTRENANFNNTNEHFASSVSSLPRPLPPKNKSLKNTLHSFQGNQDTLLQA